MNNPQSLRHLAAEAVSDHFNCGRHLVTHLKDALPASVMAELVRHHRRGCVSVRLDWSVVQDRRYCVTCTWETLGWSNLTSLANTLAYRNIRLNTWKRTEADYRCDLCGDVCWSSLDYLAPSFDPVCGCSLEEFGFPEDDHRRRTKKQRTV